jgi:hypothetical protein
MKTLILMILTLVTADIFAQRKLPPTYYLNSEQIDIENVLIKPSNIDEMKVETKTEGGEVYITAKPDLKFLTLDDILIRNGGSIDSAAQVVYIVDDRVIEDKSKVKVDGSYFIDFKILRLEKVNYVNEKYKDLIFVEIKLLNEKPKPVIRIRGDEGLQTSN